MPHDSRPATQPSAAARPECTAGFVFAMDVEADAFAGLASHTVEYAAPGCRLYEGFVAGRQVAWCVSGAGREAAARGARLLIDGHRPRVLVSAGFAGGLDPGLARGTIAHARRSLTQQGGPPIELANVSVLAGGNAAGGNPPRSVIEGAATGGPALLSVDRVVATAAEKHRLAHATGAALVDMETYAVAVVARDAGLPCVSIRVISDDASQDLPREIAALVQPQSGMRRLGAALAGIGRRPRAALDMWRLWEHAVIDGRTLAHALRGHLES